jgi:2-methylcitrate dehydratase
MKITQALLAFAADTRFEDLPAGVVHEARRYLLDALGCALGGHTIDKGRIAAAHGARFVGADEAGIVGLSGSVHASAAAFANAELVNALDHDSLPHVVPITLPAVLAVAQRERVSGRDFIVALVVAHEIGQRLARASSAMIQSLTETGRTPDAFGINNESVIGAALGCSRLLGHAADQRGNALGLAAYYGSPGVARDWEDATPKSMTKYTPVGLLAGNAVQAALLAGAGYSAHPDVLDAPFGFARFHGSGRWQPALVVDGLGKQWVFVDQQYKPWPCCRFFHSQLDLLQQLMERECFGAAEVEAIDSRGPTFVANAAPYDTGTAIDVQFSLPFCMALVAHGVAPDATWQSRETLARPELHSFARRVRMHADERSLQGKRADPRSWWARVEVTLRDGRTLRAETTHARGTNGTVFALDDAALEAKFRRHGAVRLSARRLDLAVNCLWQIDRMTDLRQLTALLASAPT